MGHKFFAETQFLIDENQLQARIRLDRLPSFMRWNSATRSSNSARCEASRRRNLAWCVRRAELRKGLNRPHASCASTVFEYLADEAGAPCGVVTAATVGLFFQERTISLPAFAKL